MAITLADIRARLQAQENKAASFKGNADKGVYPHWSIPSNSSAKLRFLPDGNSKNDFFWVERQIIKLPFVGVKGQPDSKPVTVHVPCVEMWVPNSCPILAEVRPWFKDENLKDMGSKYWKKRSYILQGFVRENPITDDESPENPIRRFIMSPGIFNMVKAALLDPELEELPTDLVRGLDFIVTKTVKAGTQFADYNTSKWSRKESALTTAEQEAIEKFGLFNLEDFLPKRPSDVELKVQHEMFEASVDGQPYDQEKWGQYYKPYGMRGDAEVPTETVDSDDSDATATQATKAPVSTPKVVVKKEEANPAEEKVVTKSGNRAQDIIAAIKNRNSANKQ